MTLATGLRLKQEGSLDLIRGLYALCPYIAGIWPLEENPSSTENNGILLDLHNNQGAMGYGIEELEKRNPLAWPGFASEDDVRGLRLEMNGRFGAIDGRFDRLHAMFVSLMIGIGGLVIAVGGLWFKL